MKEEYWVCIIGPTTRDKIPDGGDFPMRRAAKRAFRDLVGHDAEECSSGWGYSEEQVEAMRKAAYSEEE